MLSRINEDDTKEEIKLINHEKKTMATFKDIAGSPISKTSTPIQIGLRKKWTKKEKNLQILMKKIL